MLKIYDFIDEWRRRKHFTRRSRIYRRLLFLYKKKKKIRDPMFSLNSSKNPYRIHFPAIHSLHVHVYIFALGGLLQTLTNVESKFTVVSSFRNSYPKFLFAAETNLDEPSPLDPATADPSTRFRICEELSRSGVFAGYGMRPVSTEEMLREIRQPRYADIFKTIFETTEYRDWIPLHTYVNPYKLLEVEINEYVFRRTVTHRVISKKEYLFVCLLKMEHSRNESEDSSDQSEDEEEEEEEDSTSAENFENFYYTMIDSDDEDVAEMDLEDERADDDTDMNNNEVVEMGRQDGRVDDDTEMDDNQVDEEDSSNEGSNSTPSTDIIFFYVSKLYDAHRGLHAHRFVLLDKRDPEDAEDTMFVMQATESARVHVRPDFNVELHYIELRKHHRPAENCRHDPVCKLNLVSSGYNQLFRLCATVLMSSHFDDRGIRYHGRMIRTLNFWLTEQIFFRTAEGLEKAAGKFYKEFVLCCNAETNEGNEQAFYISRAYNPNQVFVLTRDPESEALYLENLITDVSIVQERYNFGDVEI